MDAALISGAADQLRPPPDDDAAAAEHLPEVQRLVDAVRACLNALPAIKSKGEPTSKSAATQEEYLKLARQLLHRGNTGEDDLVSVVSNTGRSTTFYKRLAALRYHCLWSVGAMSSALPQAWDTSTRERLMASCSQLLMTMRALVRLQQQGMTQPRSKRRSKRQALRGLPSTWREDICARGMHGKYADALLISALTGARPSELAKGIDVWVEFDDLLRKDILCLHVIGAKVKASQGQPNRFVAYAEDDTHPLVAALVKRLSTEPGKKLRVKIAEAGNFTAEIQRLARSLWRNHDHAITATCFRHQWSADLKASADGDAASRGLGHRSAKTRRHYGMAHQARGGHALRPVRIEADLPVRTFRPNLYPGTPALRIE